MKDTLIGAVVLLIAAVYFLHGTARIVAVGLILFGVVTSIYETKRSKNTDDNHHLKGDEIEEDDMVEDAGKMEDEEETVDDEEIDEEVETIEKMMRLKTMKKLKLLILNVLIMKVKKIQQKVT